MLDETLQAFMDFQKGLLGQLDARQKEILAANTKLVYELQVINTNRLQTELDLIVENSVKKQKELIRQFQKLLQDLTRNFNGIRRSLELEAKAAFDELHVKLDSLAGPVAVNNLYETLSEKVTASFESIQEDLVTSSDKIQVAFAAYKDELQAELTRITAAEPDPEEDEGGDTPTEPETPTEPDTPTDPVDPTEPGKGGENGGNDEPTNPPVTPENPENPGEGGNDNPEPTDLGDIEGGNGNELDPTLTEGNEGGSGNDLDPTDPLVDPAP